VADSYGPNSAQVQWVRHRLEHLGVAEWRDLAGLTRDAEAEEKLQDALADVKRRGAGELVQAVFELADQVAEPPTQASQRLRGELRAREVPITASGWTGELEGTRVEYLAPEDRYPFRQAARDVLMLTAMRPYGSAEAFAGLWSRFERLIGLLEAEGEGRVDLCPVGATLPEPPRP
jgi:hypothetical protein